MRVHFIAPWYLTYPILCDSLRLQTHKDWTLDIIHDGPQTASHFGEWIYDGRIGIFEMPKRYDDWGHSLRDWALARVPDEPDYIVVTNHDNYYATTFLEEMLAAADGHDGAYCDMIHSHVFPPSKHRYEFRECRLACNWIDCGALMVRAGLALSTPWTSRRFAADWDWMADLLKQTTDFVHVPLPLYVHN